MRRGGTAYQRPQTGRCDEGIQKRSECIAYVRVVSIADGCRGDLRRSDSGGRWRYLGADGDWERGWNGVTGGSHQSGATGSAANGSPSLLDPGPSPFPDNSRQKRNEERQRRLVSDTQKLVALTAQLKDEVAASGAEAMTPEMLKQMDEIEKLAKSVKDKMRD